MNIFIETIANYFDSIDKIIESIGAVLTIICVWLNTKENRWGWIVGIVSTCCYIYVFFQFFLFSDFLLNIFFLVTSIYGWYNWQYGDKTKPDLPVSTISLHNLLIAIVIGSIFSVILGFSISRLATQAAVPYWDATIAAFSVVAQWLLTKKKIENWGFWIFVNIICVPVYYSRGLLVTSVLYFILLLLAIKGYYDWRKNLKLNNFH